jgi:hypothetical protein
MTNILGWNWVVNIDKMTCKNVENAVTIKIKKKGANFKGMISDMPIDFFFEIAKYVNGERIIEKIVKTAEEEYVRAGSGERF